MFLDDAESFTAVIAAMPVKDRTLYESYGALTLEAGFPNRVMVVYTLSKDRPVDIEILTLGGMEMTRVGGPTVELEGKQGLQVLGVKPKRWGTRDLFLHVPQNFIFRWKGKQTPKGVQYVPHYAILIKTRSREHLQVEGDTYCVTLNKFRERFPKVPARY